MGWMTLYHTNHVVQAPDLSALVARSQLDTAPVSRLRNWWPNVYWRQRGYSGSFAGTGYVSISNSASLQITGPLTIEAWVYPTVFTQDGGANRTIVHKSTLHEYSLSVDTAGRLVLAFGTGTAATTVTAENAILTLNRWHHVAVVRNTTTARVQFYVNGVLKDDIAYTAVTVASSTANVFLAAASATTGRWSGYITDVRIWAAARSAQEVLNDYANAITSAVNLRGNWRFDEGAGTIVSDSSGNANNGTASAMTWAIMRPEWLTASWSAAKTISGVAVMATNLASTSTVLFDTASAGTWTRRQQLSVVSGPVFYSSFGSITADAARVVLLPATADQMQVGTLFIGEASSLPLPVLPIQTRWVDASVVQAVIPWLPFGLLRGTAPQVRFEWRLVTKSDVDIVVEKTWRRNRSLYPTLMFFGDEPDPAGAIDGLYVFAEPPSEEQVVGTAYRVEASAYKLWPEAGAP